jgi:hypothetical protein
MIRQMTQEVGEMQFRTLAVRRIGRGRVGKVLIVSVFAWSTLPLVRFGLYDAVSGRPKVSSL